jgi:hypothetical protein
MLVALSVLFNDHPDTAAAPCLHADSPTLLRAR